MRRWLPLLGALAASTVVGCDADDGEDVAAEADATGGDVVAVETTTAAPETEVTPETTEPDPTLVTVGPSACCLTMQDDLVIWSEEGDLFSWNAVTNEKSLLVGAAGMQKDPVVVGDVLVWADNRDGDFDLWMMELSPERTEPRLLRGGPGDQDQPAIDGTRLVWIGRDEAPHTAREAEVFTMDLSAPDSERRLTNDGFEQTQPALSGHRIVWADFKNSPDAQYLDLADPLRNNADIFGWDLEADEGFIVTQDPSKQLRPAIEDEVVTWLDWRGINPEPKYSQFQIFVRRLSETGPEAERQLVWSSWDRPELWRRPVISDGLVVFIAEPTEGGEFVTGVWAAPIDGGTPWLVAGSNSVLDSVAVAGNKAAYVGARTLGRVEIRTR